MNINLDAREVDLLRQILATYVSDLRLEISDTDRADLRQALKRDEATITGLIGRLGAPPAKSD